ncbi:two-component regulator propeller domain-containing protein [candidate division CSSED10-310 bacterium]|uniref:Two-component regulator propeller domain-containing protein n=1 Tax=candidate division CSSED10-310 bacterium TaxID=2855610 RepID=A0ABV6Z177_UNCC1
MSKLSISSWKLVCLVGVITLVLTFDLSAHSTDVKFERLSAVQGLSPSAIYTIVQDRQGFMWFGGESGGLIRYDSYTFKFYRHDSRNPDSISNNNISQICEDKQGMLWCATWGGGISRFDPRTESFRNYIHDPFNPQSLSDNRIQICYEDSQGVFWFGTFNGGLNRMQNQSGEFTIYRHDPKDPRSLSSNHVWCVCEDLEGNFWVATSEGLDKLDRASGQFTHFKHDPEDSNSLSHNEIRWLYVDRQGILWISTRGGLNHYNVKTGKFQRYPNIITGTDTILPYKILEDQYGTLWIGTRNYGLIKFNRETGEFNPYQHDTTDPYSLSHNDIRSLYQDRSGLLWIGTRGGGLNKVDLNPKKFHHYRQEPNDPESLSYNDIRAIYTDKAGTVWIGTLGKGLNKLSQDRKRFFHYQHDRTDPHSLCNNFVWAIMEDSSGMLWIGTENGVDQFDRNSQRFIHYKHDPADPNSLSHNDISSIIEDRAGMLWIGTWGGGMNKLSRDRRTFSHYKHDESDPNSISHNNVRIIYQDQIGGLWIGTINGLDKWDPENKRFIHHKYEINNPRSLSDNEVLSICEDDQGVLWIGTKNNLNKYDRKQRRFYNYCTDSGLPDNVIFGILNESKSAQYEGGHLWLSTNYGLSKFNPMKETFHNFDCRDGLQSYVFTLNSYHKSIKGEMFFGGINGFNAFYPERVQKNPHIPNIVITDFKIFNKSVSPTRNSFLKKSIVYTRELLLSYKDKVFSFDFAALDYTISEKNQFAYKLEGFDKEWIYIGTKHWTTYTNLAPGKYTFRVKGSNNDGVWNQEGCSLAIKITPPPWKTWWAYTFYSFLFFGSLFAYFKYTKSMSLLELEQRRKELELRLAKESAEAAAQYKGDFLTSMSHELRTPMKTIMNLSDLAMKSDWVAQKRDCLHKIKTSAGYLHGIVNYIIDFSKIETGKIKLESTRFKLPDVMINLSNMLSDKAAEKGIELTVSIYEDVPETLIGDSQRLGQILFILTNNAIKLTEAGEVLIRVIQIEKNAGVVRLQFSILNTGTSRSREQISHLFDPFVQVDRTGKYASPDHGLTITKTLVEMMNGKIWAYGMEGEENTIYFEVELEYKS